MSSHHFLSNQRMKSILLHMYRHVLKVPSKLAFYNSFNDSYKTTGIFIDFRKAFDLVNHEVLLKTLELGLLDYWLDNVPG